MNLTRKRTFLQPIVLFLIFMVLTETSSAPTLTQTNQTNEEIENSLDRFLNLYFENYLKNEDTEVNLPKTLEEDIIKKSRHQNRDLLEKKPEDEPINIYETMQGDQPVVENAVKTQNINSAPEVANSNFSNANYIRTMRERRKNGLVDDRVSQNWLQVIKQNILKQLGREGNITMPRTEETRLSNLNISEIIPNLLNSSNFRNDDQITEKMRSFYPSCDIPGNTDQDLWKDDDMMNLFFNFDYAPDNKNSNIATATLRLYRLPSQNGTKLGSKKDDCDTVTYNMDFLEEDRLLRVSIYWYTKPLKKRRGSVKRRLCDSKMVSETSRWVELSVKPATKAWTRGRNLGLGVLVEDQDGNMLRADRYFKGASCMQPPNQSQPSSLTQLEKPTNLTELIAYVEEIQRQPFIVTYNCYQP